MPGVVVGLTASGTSARTLAWARDEAALRGLPLTTLHVWDVPVEVELEHGLEHEIATNGDPLTVLLAHDAELLVLGTALQTRHLSPLVRRCLHAAACPVALVPPEADRPETRQVVVGLNGTAASAEALRWAAEEVVLRAAELVVVHAWQVHPHSAADVLTPARAVPEQQGPAVDRLAGWVREVLGSTEGVTLRASHGGALDGLLDAAARADLLVLGQPTHGVLRRLVLGAVGDEAGALAGCPVVAVPAGARVYSEA